MTTIQERLAEYFEQQASWREMKAEEYPEDDRNARASRGLGDLAEYVRGLPDDDPRLREIAAWNDPIGDDMLYVHPSSETGGNEASRFRFDDPSESLDGFLTGFAEDCAGAYAHALGDSNSLSELVDRMEDHEARNFPQGTLALLDLIRERLEQVEAQAVARLRDDHEYTWERIGRLLDVSKQAAWEKHRRLVLEEAP